MKKTVLTAAIAALVCTTPAMAHDHEGKVDHYFSKIDVNNDGSISKAEHESFANVMFVETDTNKDGALSKNEVMAQKKKEKERMKSESMDNNPNAKMNTSHGEKQNTNPTDHSVNK